MPPLTDSWKKKMVTIGVGGYLFDLLIFGGTSGEALLERGCHREQIFLHAVTLLISNYEAI